MKMRPSLCILAVTCAAMSGWAAELNTLSALKVLPTPSGCQILVQGSKAPTFTVFRLNDPDRLVVDFSSADASAIGGHHDGTGPVAGIVASQFSDAHASVGRVVVSLEQASQYDVHADGDRVVIAVAGGPAPNAAPATPPLQPSMPPAAPAPEALAVEPKPPQVAAVAPVPADPTPSAAPVEMPPAPAPANDVVASQVDEQPVKVPARHLTAITFQKDTLRLRADGDIGKYEIVTLRHGAKAIRDRASGEIMHPSVGPWVEANQLYVDQSRLSERLSAPGDGPVVIFDVGLGGGANAIAALTRARDLGRERARPLTVVSFDRSLEALLLAASAEAAFPFLSPWRTAVDALSDAGAWTEGDLSWRYLPGDFRDQVAQAGVLADVVFFDPFSPNAEPECWSVKALTQMRGGMRDSPPATLFTYSAATPTRVALLLSGLYVGAGLGVATKVETTVAATAPEALASPLGERWLARWRRSPHRGPHGQDFDEDIAHRVCAHPQFSLITKS
jgi:tRNA U34 5-methylaminomethyl-2-thiouridine-forming methyltransferase MnmC